MIRIVIKYILALIFIVLIVYNSVSINKLDKSNSLETASFNAKGYAADYLHRKLPSHQDHITPARKFLADFHGNHDQVYAYSHAQNNGSIRFFMIKGEAEISKIDSTKMEVKVDDAFPPLTLATTYIVGNAGRDGAGLISMDEFTNSMELNEVSEEINKLIRKEVLPPFRKKANVGDSVAFIGAFQLDNTLPKTQDFEMIPLVLTFNHHE